jgi:hypothetical protein
MYFCSGELAEWSIAAVLKTVDLHGSGGSNPSLSANQQVVVRLPFFVFGSSLYPINNPKATGEPVQPFPESFTFLCGDRQNLPG